MREVNGLLRFSRWRSGKTLAGRARRIRLLYALIIIVAILGIGYVAYQNGPAPDSLQNSSIEDLTRNSERYCGSGTKVRVVGTLLSIEAYHELINVKYVITDEQSYQIVLTKLLEGNAQPYLFGEKYEVEGYMVLQPVENIIIGGVNKECRLDPVSIRKV
jgi:hypothetical protein